MIFNVFFHYKIKCQYTKNVMRESVDEFTGIGVTVSGRTINNLRYADDIVLIATSQESPTGTDQQAEYCITLVRPGDQHKENQSTGGFN